MRKVTETRFQPGGERHRYSEPNYSETARTTTRLHGQPGEWLRVTAEVPARAVPGMRGPDAERKRDGARSSLVWDVLAEVIAARVAQTGRTALDIVDVGAGTGRFAVSMASQGHRVTVVDPSPD